MYMYMSIYIYIYIIYIYISVLTTEKQPSSGESGRAPDAHHKISVPQGPAPWKP